jgi:hypothetical protein
MPAHLFFLNSDRVSEHRNQRSMGFRASRRAIRLTAGVFIALAAICAVLPRTASAGCSSHLAARMDPFAQLAPVEILERFAVSTESGPVAATPAAPKPCSGPFCSERRSDPGRVPSVPERIRLDRWGFLSEALTLEAPAERLLPPADSAGEPSRHNLSIDRPPRLPGASTR